MPLDRPEVRRGDCRRVAHLRTGIFSARSTIRRAAWCAVATGTLVGALDGASRVWHLSCVFPRMCSLAVFDGTATIIVIQDKSAWVSEPRPGVNVSRVAAGYAIASNGAATFEEPFSFLRRSRGNPSGTVLWTAMVVRLVWLWPALLVAGAAALKVTRRFGKGLCRACGYPLKGLPLGATRCPECGRAVEGAIDLPPPSRPQIRPPGSIPESPDSRS
jgi:hypothetical protein